MEHQDKTNDTQVPRDEKVSIRIEPASSPTCAECYVQGYRAAMGDVWCSVVAACIVFFLIRWLIPR